MPTQKEIDAVAAVFEKLSHDPVAAASAIITTKMLKRALEGAREHYDTPELCREMALYWMGREKALRAALANGEG